VISLFTNIPIDMIVDLLNNRWNIIEPHAKIPKQEFLDGIKFMLNSTYFNNKFNDKIYKQTFEAMGSPFFPL